MAEIGKDINKARQLLESGQLVAIPTETVYGLAGNALDKSVVVKIFEAKNRPEFDPLIVHVPSLEHGHRYAEKIPEKAFLLAEKFWPGPLTIVLRKKSIIPDIVSSGLDTVGLRCPDHSLTQSLLRELPFPVAAPSANPFGYVSPTTPEHVNEQLGSKIAYILDGGACKVGIESTIIGFVQKDSFGENDSPIIYRMGGLTVEKIESVIGRVQVQLHSASNPKAPGQLKSHYSPSKKVVIGNIDELRQKYPAQSSGIISFQKDFNSPFQFILSRSGSLEEAAQNLFTALRQLDKYDVDVILTELVPDSGLGKAINDRLRRAAVR